MYYDFDVASYDGDCKTRQTEDLERQHPRHRETRQDLPEARLDALVLPVLHLIFPVLPSCLVSSISFSSCCCSFDASRQQNHYCSTRSDAECCDTNLDSYLRAVVECKLRVIQYRTITYSPISTLSSYEAEHSCSFLRKLEEEVCDRYR